MISVLQSVQDPQCKLENKFVTVEVTHWSRVRGWKIKDPEVGHPDMWVKVPESKISQFHAIDLVGTNVVIIIFVVAGESEVARDFLLSTGSIVK